MYYHRIRRVLVVVSSNLSFYSVSRQRTTADSRIPQVLQETEREANEDPFGSEDENTVSAAGSSKAPITSIATNPTSSLSPYSAPKPSKKSKPDKFFKKYKLKTFNLEREKPQLLETIASSSVASTNLMNSLKLLNREHVRVCEHTETVHRFETCKALRRQILRYIQFVESEQWLGSLINANDGLVEALMAFEILDKSVDDDSDSDGNEWDGDEAPAKPAGLEPAKEKSVREAFPGLNIAKSPRKSHPTMPLSGQGAAKFVEDEDSEAEDEDDPFADSNAVHTPKTERLGMTW